MTNTNQSEYYLESILIENNIDIIDLILIICFCIFMLIFIK